MTPAQTSVNTATDTTATPVDESSTNWQLRRLYLERCLTRFLIGFIPVFSLTTLPLWWFEIAERFSEAAEVGVTFGAAAGFVSITIAEMIGSFLDIPNELPVGPALPVAVLLTFASGIAADAARLTIVDPLIEALWARQTITITTSQDGSPGSSSPNPSEEELSRRSVLLGADGEPGMTVAALRLDVPAVLYSLLARERGASRYRRPRASTAHSYDVALILRALATGAVLYVFFLTGVVPRMILFVGIGYLGVVSVLMLFSDVVLGPNHAVFWVAYVGLPAVAFGLYLWQLWRYRGHPMRRLLAPRLTSPLSQSSSTAEHYEAFRAGRLSVAAVLDGFMERHSAAAPALARNPRSHVWRFFFAGLFQPDLRDLAELYFVHGRRLTLSDFHRRPLFERFAEDPSVDLAASRVAPNPDPSGGPDPTESASCTETAPLASRELTVELAHDPYVADVMNVLRTGNVHDLAQELVTAQLHDFAEVRNRPLAWWRRILRMPPKTATHHEQVQTILEQLKSVIDDATNLVRSQASLSQAFREAVIAAETANLDFKETKETKLANIADQQARAAEARERRRKAEAPIEPDEHERKRREEERAAEHAAGVAFHKAEKAKHEAQARGHRRERTAPTPTGAPSTPPVTAAERRALLLRAEQVKAEVISKAEVRARKELDDLKSEFGQDAEEYRDREAYWNHRLITLKEREPAGFLGQDDQERLHHV